ncbi:head decoration protein [Salmonella phage 41]|nr:head decoration protein [Salmonella phage 41]
MKELVESRVTMKSDSIAWKSCIDIVNAVQEYAGYLMDIIVLKCAAAEW